MKSSESDLNQIVSPLVSEEKFALKIPKSIIIFEGLYKFA